MEKDPHEVKLDADLRILEQELTKMANRIGVLNQQVNAEQVKSKKLKEELISCKARIENREKQISQEAQDKRILTGKINKAERENAKLKKILSDKNLTILEPRSAAPVLMRPYSNNSNNNSDEGDNTNDFPVRKDSLTDQINKNIENVFK